MQVEVSPHPAVPCQPLTPRTVRARFLLLVVDPDLTGAEALSRQLHDRQIDVVVTDNPADGLLQAGALLPDAVLTAADVPPMRGSTIARALSSRTGIPTLVGVGIDDRNEGRIAVSSGARACVDRPYRMTQILPILQSISHDAPAELQPVIEVGKLRLDPAAHEVHLRGQRVDLPLREFELLHLLMLHAGRVLTRHQIHRIVWSQQAETSNTLSVHIKRIRARLGDDPRDPRIIVAVRGLGYRLDPPD